jgi:hypothetical protein
VAVRLALWVPLIVALTSVPRLVSGTTPGGAAWFTEDWRFWFYLVAPAVFALIVLYTASKYAAWLAGPARLPRFARAVVEMDRTEPLPEAGLARHATTLTRFGRIRLALRTVAEATILLFLAVPIPAILFGFLFRSGVYRPGEAVIVGLFAAVEIGWLVFLLSRYVTWRRPG